MKLRVAPSTFKLATCEDHRVSSPGLPPRATQPSASLCQSTSITVVELFVKLGEAKELNNLLELKVGTGVHGGDHMRLRRDQWQCNIRPPRLSGETSMGGRAELVVETLGRPALQQELTIADGRSWVSLSFLSSCFEKVRSVHGRLGRSGHGNADRTGLELRRCTSITSIFDGVWRTLDSPDAASAAETAPPLRLRDPYQATLDGVALPHWAPAPLQWQRGSPAGSPRRSKSSHVPRLFRTRRLF